ncbi:hypothetical protein GTQ99_22205 [Kineococcus sp. T13]|uniref:hypothetical protein n=1 Tax=Kineococcus vitellinus TaxID=2696565 RepID=UPI001412E231|nr:hypothetical protein [Kineococcus vitellinus]NAZ78099.1 hypothetical protein [Kineococcus vitellinus]
MLRAVGVLVSGALARASEAVRQEEAAQDVAAVPTLIRELTTATGEEQALRVALETIRRDFDRQHGSFWRLAEPTTGSGPASGQHGGQHGGPVLRFELEFGDAGEQFRRVTLQASFVEGVGLSGRAWASSGGAPISPATTWSLGRRWRSPVDRPGRSGRLERSTPVRLLVPASTACSGPACLVPEVARDAIKACGSFDRMEVTTAAARRAP